MWRLLHMSSRLTDDHLQSKTSSKPQFQNCLLSYKTPFKQMCKCNQSIAEKGVFGQDEPQVKKKKKEKALPSPPPPRAVYGIFHAIMPGLLQLWCPRPILAGLYSALQTVHTAIPHINKQRKADFPLPTYVLNKEHQDPPTEHWNRLTGLVTSFRCRTVSR